MPSLTVMQVPSCWLMRLHPSSPLADNLCHINFNSTRIIICFNSWLDVEDETEITKHAASKNVRIELIGLDWLAVEIYSKYPILAKDMLGIPLDTGQLLPLAHFILEYDNKAGKLSTPLNNQFLHRTTELDDIDQYLPVTTLSFFLGFQESAKPR